MPPKPYNIPFNLRSAFKHYTEDEKQHIYTLLSIRNKVSHQLTGHRVDKGKSLEQRELARLQKELDALNWMILVLSEMEEIEE